jgi:hypothetical protein
LEPDPHSGNRTKIVRENHLDFLDKLYHEGIDIGPANIEKLRAGNYLQKDIPTKEKRREIVSDIINQSRLNRDSDSSREADGFLDIVDSRHIGETVQEFEILSDTELEARRIDHGLIFEGRNNKPILRNEWMPTSITEHSPRFIDWINSINKNGFSNKIQYREFNLYCQQAYQWLHENKTSADFEDDDEREEYRQEELRRCDDNALYFLNKYVWYQEGNAEDGSGRIKYTASKAHEFLAYMDDCGYSMGIAKGRQMAATTTIMALNMRKVVFRQNYFTKFITEDDDKAIEIFEDKLKYAFGELPDWMKPDILNDRDNLFKTGKKGAKKGSKEGVGASIRLAVPKRTAIAGGAPQEVMIDEAGNIKILGIMIGNARPTMLWYNKRTKKLQLKRRLVFWGTGGEMDKGGKAFETELMALMSQWDEGNYSSGIVPIFFDWTCRPGATQEDYDNEKYVAYKKAENNQDPDAKKHITEFHQTWPRSLSDVFRTSAKTLVDDEYIEASLVRIGKAKQNKGYTLHQSGYFEPIYDTNIEMIEGSLVPYKIIGATFIPTEDIDRRASVTIFMQPDHKWRDRYFIGVDPIDTNSGLSDFSSVVWDKYWKTPSAILNFRVPNYPEVFLQALLLSLYYDPREIKIGTKELIESNRGTSYYQFLVSMGYGEECVLNYQLPHSFQNKTTINEGVGIDNKGIRNTMLINRMFELFKTYGENFYHTILFEQLKTFTCVISGGGKEMWGPINKKYFKDDTLWGTTFSYICAELCFPELVPKNMDVVRKEYKLTSKLMRGKDGKLSRVTVREKI